MLLSHDKDFSENELEEHHPSYAFARYKAYFFGPFHVEINGQALKEATWRRNKARTLLKWFLLNPGDLFSMEQLSKLFWPGASKKVAASNLHVTLHYLRHVLEPELAPGSPSTFIRRNRHNYYWFDTHGLWWTDVFDVQYLTNAVQEAERTKAHGRTLALSDQLLAYYDQAFLPEDIYEDIFSPYRRQHDYAHAQLLERSMQLCIYAGRGEDALACALRVLAKDPYNEDAVKMLVQGYVQQGNTTGALRQLDDFRESLKDDLGIEPGTELLSLRSRILRTR